MIQDKKDHGTGMQGFQWSSLMLQLAQTIVMISPAAYNTLKTFLPLPEVRTLQYVYFITNNVAILINPC